MVPTGLLERARYCGREKLTAGSRANGLTERRSRRMRMSATVRVSPISRTAAILIIAVGLFVLTAGLVTGALASDIAGGAFIVLGVVLYLLLYKFTRKLQNEIAGAQKN